MTSLALGILLAAVSVAPAKDGMEYVPVPAASGGRPFLIGRSEVTVAAFRRFAEATGRVTLAEMDGWSWIVRDGDLVKGEGASWRSAGFDQGEDHPAVHVSWYDAEAYCAWAGGRLPSENEWEQAARAGPQSGRYVWGDAPLPVVSAKPQANVADEALRRVVRGLKIFEGYDDGHIFTTPAGTFPPNPLGLVDMAGNVSEWCAEWFDDKRVQRVLRGGSWMNDAEELAIAFRIPDRAASHLPFVGFRCVRDVAP